MHRISGLLFSCLFLLLASVTLHAENLPQPLPADVRVIIDISGSMKKTDPTNLRKPAVELIVRLLPDKSKAGIWTFGQSVNMLVPHRVVDEQWRKEGAQKASAINSIAKYTHIGAALEKATEDYAKPGADYRHNVILLTDGVVDIGPEAVGNLNERKRILTELLPRLKTAGYVVHTIALSNDADQELMKKLALGTDGVFAVAETADKLMSTFLRIFDQAVPAERVPLNDNGFLVDVSIQEFTALIFRKAGVPATIIIAPDGKEYSGTDPQNNVNWYKTDKYDLITVQQPKAGQWKIKTEMAPDSRVTVVSNLQLVVKPPQNNIKRNQPLELTYSFQENNQTVTKTEFLQLLSAEAWVAKLNTQEENANRNLTAEKIPADGIFRASLKEFEDGGEYDIRLIVDGKTFKREFFHHLSVSDSLFKLDKSQAEKEGKLTYQYKLSADLETIDVANTQVTVAIKNSLNNNMEKPLNAINKDHWEFAFTPVQVAKYTITMQIASKEIDGSVVNEIITADEFYYPDEATVKKAEEAKAAAATSSAATSKPIEHPVVEEKVAEEKTENHVWFYIGIAAGNLLLLAMGYFAYRLIAGRKTKDELAEIEQTLSTDIDTLKKSNGDATSKAKTVIDVSDDETAHIPMSEPRKTSPADDMMADNLFPLDNMDDTPDNKDKS